MIKIIHNKKVYYIEKQKILYTLKKIINADVKEEEIRELMKKYHLYDEYFLENISKIFN